VGKKFQLQLLGFLWVILSVQPTTIKNEVGSIKATHKGWGFYPSADTNALPGGKPTLRKKDFFAH